MGGDETVPELPCPACGYRTMPEATYGSFHICEVCGWEDDPVQLANPACEGGANGESLVDAQLRVSREPALEVGRFVRDSDWRPLDSRETEAAIGERDRAAWQNPAVYELDSTYWKKTSGFGGGLTGQ